MRMLAPGRLSLLVLLSGAVAVLGLQAELGSLDAVTMLNDDVELEQGIEFHPPNSARDIAERVHAKVEADRAAAKASEEVVSPDADGGIILGASMGQVPNATGDSNATAPVPDETDPALNGNPDDPDTKVAKAKKLDKEGQKTLDESAKYKKLAEEKLKAAAEMEGKPPAVKTKVPVSAPTSADDNCKDTPGLKCSEKVHLCESPAFGKEIRDQCRASCGECTSSLAVPDKPAGAQWVVKAVKREARQAVKDAVAKATDEIKELIKDKLKPPEAPPPQPADMSVDEATKKIMSLLEEKMKAHPEALKVVKAAVTSVSPAAAATAPAPAPAPAAVPMANATANATNSTAAATPAAATPAAATPAAATPAPAAASPAPIVVTAPPAPAPDAPTEMAATGDGDGDDDEVNETSADGDGDDEDDEVSGDGDGAM